MINDPKRFLITACLFLVFFAPAFSQSGKVPPFRMTDIKGNVFKAENLPFEKPIMIVYFSPECEDCHAFINSLIKQIDDFRNVSIALITYLPVDMLKDFVISNKLDKYPNIYAGTEGNTLFVRDYYNVMKLPFVAVYNKNGDLLKTYNDQFNLDEISGQLNKPVK